MDNKVVLTPEQGTVVAAVIQELVGRGIKAEDLLIPVGSLYQTVLQQLRTIQQKKQQQKQVTKQEEEKTQ